MPDPDNKSVTARCSANIEALKKSATFAMSLGAKELFHTNFLAFLLESEDPELEQLRRGLRDALKFPVESDELSTCAVWREKRHMDLILVPLLRAADEAGELVLNNKRAHIVEAKLKSVPTREQLRRYDKALDEGFKLTLESDTPTKTVWLGPANKKKEPGQVITKTLLSTSDREVQSGWTPTIWVEVSTAIASNLPLNDPSELTTILCDYSKSLGQLVTVVDAASTRASELLKTGAPFAQLLSETADPQFSRIRLKYLVSKVMYDTWLRDETAKLEDEEALYEAYVVYTHSIPGIGLEYEIPTSNKDNPLRIGVQIQGTEFRHYLAAVDDTSNLQDIARSEPLWTEWLHTSTALGKLEGRRNPRPDDATDLRAYNKKRFVFRCIPITDQATLEDISKALQESLRLAREIAQRESVSELAKTAM